MEGKATLAVFHMSKISVVGGSSIVTRTKPCARRSFMTCKRCSMPGPSACCPTASCWLGSSNGAMCAGEAAFATLVDRHGPMLLGVCRRVVGDEHIAADACQAVFLVLAKKARSVRVYDSLAPWLYGVSVRVAKKARAKRLAKRAQWTRIEHCDVADHADPPTSSQRAELEAGFRPEIGACRSAIAPRSCAVTSRD